MTLHLDESSFKRAITDLYALSQCETGTDLRTELVQEHDGTMLGLSISRPLHELLDVRSRSGERTGSPGDEDVDLDLQDLSDDERLPPGSSDPTAPTHESLAERAHGDSGRCGTVTYEVFHSPTYRVPVLYIRFLDAQSRMIKSPVANEILELLLPDPARGQIKSVGVMGGISLTDHPVSGLAYFVHPCRTAEAMGSVAAGRDVSGVEYLVLWMGAIGSAVGLSLPVEVASRLG